EQFLGLPFIKPQQGRVQEYIFSTSQLRMEPGAQLQTGGYAAVHSHRAFVWFCKPYDKSQESAFARAIGADNGYTFLSSYSERDMLQRIKRVVIRFASEQVAD